MSNAARIIQSDLLPILDQVIDFMEVAITTKQADDTRMVELTRQLQDATKKAQRTPERVVLEKVASPVLAEQPMEEAFKRLRSMGLMDERTTNKMAARIKQDPNVVFPLLVKLAEGLQNAPAEGQGTGRRAMSQDNDPDGWTDFAEGRPPARKR